MEDKKFNKAQYDMDYRKMHKAQLNVDINKDEKDELDMLLKDNMMSKTDFIRNAINQLKDQPIRVYIYEDAVVFNKEDEDGNEYMTEAFYINKDNHGNECVGLNILDVIDTILNINKHNILFFNKRNEKYYN